ncbi:MAG: Hsp20/alpha crystallin family protein [Vicinamibacterales bacterium]
MAKKETALTPKRAEHDPFALMREMRDEFDRFFNEPAWPAFRWPAFRLGRAAQAGWNPGIDVFERDNRLVTKIDLPGLKKEDIKVEVTDGHLAISGERKKEEEEKGEQFYRCEREYGSFYRAVPLPEGLKLEDVKATFADGVLEVSVPLPAKAEATVRKVAIEEPPKAKAAA